MPLPGGQVLVGAACLLFVVVAFGSAAPCFKVVDVPPLVRTSWRIQVRQAAGGGRSLRASGAAALHARVAPRLGALPGRPSQGRLSRS